MLVCSWYLLGHIFEPGQYVGALEKLLRRPLFHEKSFFMGLGIFGGKGMVSSYDHKPPSLASWRQLFKGDFLVLLLRVNEKDKDVVLKWISLL